jgi:5'-3' exonuclease
MGIKHLHKLLQKYAPDCYEKKHLSEFAYMRVAIDISLYLYKYKAVAGDRWMESFVYLISCLRKWNIHCIFVYDNKAPVEKQEEQERRREVRAKQGDRVAELEHDLEVYENGGDPSEKMIEICKKEGVVSLLQRDNPDLVTARRRQCVDTKLIKRKIESMKSMIISITEDDLQISRDLFDHLQIPYVIAPSEAEAYSSYLCIHGKVDAVLSEDTDVIAYGAPIFLTKIDTFTDTVTVIRSESVLENLEMTKTTFVDLCIMLGCDYNTNVPKVGPEKSIAFLKKYGSIEAITEIKDEDKAILNHVRVREMFEIPTEVDFYVPYCGIPDFGKVEEFLKMHGLRCNASKLRKNLGESELSFVDD